MVRTGHTRWPLPRLDERAVTVESPHVPQPPCRPRAVKKVPAEQPTHASSVGASRPLSSSSDKYDPNLHSVLAASDDCPGTAWYLPLPHAAQNVARRAHRLGARALRVAARVGPGAAGLARGGGTGAGAGGGDAGPARRAGAGAVDGDSDVGAA